MSKFGKWAEKAAAIDVFPKVEDDNQQRSERGGLLTLIVTFCLVLLTFNELSECHYCHALSKQAEFSIGSATKYQAIEDPKYINEIIRAANGKSYDHQIAKDMGACRIYGSLKVNKVASNLHITSDGHGYASRVHTSHEVLNFTHRIDELSFGEFYPNLINPLDNSMEIAETHFEMFQYYLSVVNNACI
ncbi:hypothetical protein RO3G_03389 [Rhizopus delemar RA 99-880]|uniref:Uncharacterized protein n=1 Tax=Rhizopus delemar (strain RA 99-880 / ATCC MYA-4621 / FGSC 9543 / NRRL 43880) TaxID=246409 RepID=I1BR55_RHIO9|nr:hypothetical protein RO3G_03389 [Rhizopus delemar RA 99-880]|eukprot:EIE78685.1 hypothetical protein RO3G_03389 [Rhizopus delemar RA 99-880]